MGPNVAAAALVVALAAPAAQPASQGGGSPTPSPGAARIGVARNAATASFARGITFTLEFSSTVPVEDVVLHYRVGADGPLNRRVPELEAGRLRRAVHSEGLARGQIPPSSTIVWWWTLETADASSFTTRPRHLTYLDEAFDWRRSDYPGVTVWWYGDDTSLPDRVAAAATSSLEAAAKIIGTPTGRSISIVAYNSRQDMLPAMAARGEAYEAQLATLGARVAPDIVLLLADPGGSRRSTEEVLRHELSHVALHLAMEEPYISAPLWLDEGLAMYAEGEPDKQDRRLLASALSNDALMSVRSLTSFPGAAEQVPLAYAESRDIVAYLLDTYGQDRFRSFIVGLGSGDLSVDEALVAAYGADQDALYQAYRAARGLGPAVPPPAEPADAPGRGPLCAAALAPLAAAVALGRRRREGAAV